MNKVQLDIKDSKDSKTVVDEEKDTLIIFVCVLVPLLAVLAVLAFILIKFKLNKKESPETQEKPQYAFQRRSTIHFSKSDVITFLNESSRKQEEKVTKKDIIKMLKLITVPDEYEEACMMEGKTRIEKRKILKEIGHAREQKIHLEYMLQQEKDNTDEDFIKDLVRTVKG